jgi:hypothetical protein
MITTRPCSGTGQVCMNQVIKGVTRRPAAGTHDVPAQQWLDVEIRRVGTLTEVEVNGRFCYRGNT